MRFKSLIPDMAPSASLSHEFSDLAMNVEVVDSLAEAIKFVNRHGSGKRTGKEEEREEKRKR